MNGCGPKKNFKNGNGSGNGTFIDRPDPTETPDVVELDFKKWIPWVSIIIAILTLLITASK